MFLIRVFETRILKLFEEGKLFGAVTSQMISDELANQGLNVDKKEIVLEDSIKELNPKNLKYAVSIDEKPIVAEVVTNKTFIKKIEDKVLDYFKEMKGVKETQKEYMNAFLAKRFEIENPVIAKLRR